MSDIQVDDHVEWAAGDTKCLDQKCCSWGAGIVTEVTPRFVKALVVDGGDHPYDAGTLFELDRNQYTFRRAFLYD